MEMSPLHFIDQLRKTDVYIETIYLNGGCYAFSQLLKRMYFPSAKSLINKEKNHVVTQIGDRLYDIRGIVENEEDYQRMTLGDAKMCEKWSFSKKMFLSKVCDYCDEPLLIDERGELYN